MTFVVLRATHLRSLWERILARTKPKPPRDQRVFGITEVFLSVWSDAWYLWRLCFVQTVRCHGLEHPRGIVDHRVTKFVKVWKSPEDLPRVIGRGLCDLSSRRIRWGLGVQSYVFRTRCPGLCVLEFKYSAAPTRRTTETTVGTGLPNHCLPELTSSISSTLSFPHNCVVCLFISVFEDFDWRLSQFPQFNFFSLFVFILCYPVFTFSVLYACLHFIMMTMLVFCYAYFWVLIPLQVVLR